RPVRGAVPRLARGVRPWRGAVPVRHSRPWGADLQRVGEPGPGHPALAHGHAAAGATVRPDLPAGLDRGRRALDLLPPPADLLQRDLPRRDAPGRAARPALAAVRPLGAARRDCVHPGQPALPGGPRARRAAPGRSAPPEPGQCPERGERGERSGHPERREGRVTAPGATGSAGDWWGTEDVCVRFGGTLALDHIWFRAEPGRVSALVGGDGAGRTTLLRCLAGALAPASGRVRRPPRPAPGYLPAGRAASPGRGAPETRASRAPASGVPPQQARERSGELLARAGLDRVGDRLAGQLSGGMRQKLGVIAAM